MQFEHHRYRVSLISSFQESPHFNEFFDIEKNIIDVSNFFQSKERKFNEYIQ